ncbi:MAG: helix-turn-helix domain-containing protein [Bacilli bacterium]|nr:helix-turn-helix domain-containing protein [Bacilli bacterium]
MNLSKQFAMQMVEELSAIISQHINLIDREGTIIASTDKDRMGSCHLGAKKLISEGLPILIIDSDEEYGGSRKGVNLPITVEGEIVGVIGITGDRHRVEKYGEIIRKFTEMYIRDENLKQLRSQEEKMVSRFLENWFINPNTVFEANFQETALSLGIDLSIKRRIVIASFISRETTDIKSDQNRLDGANQFLRKSLCKHPGSYYLRIGTKLVFFILDTPDDRLKEKCNKLIKQIHDDYHWDICIGLDGGSLHYKQIHLAFIQAQKALNSAMTIQRQALMSYNDLHLELFLNEIPLGVRQEFIDKIFKGLNKEESLEAMRILDIYYANNGSIEKTANLLYIHKNTLQYKLNRLHELTGHNPRHTQSMPLYYLAMFFMKNL